MRPRVHLLNARQYKRGNTRIHIISPLHHLRVSPCPALPLHLMTVDSLALACTVLFDRRVLEQRSEIETLKRHVFWLKNGTARMRAAICEFNRTVTRCACYTCRDCGRVRVFDGEEDDRSLWKSARSWNCEFQAVFEKTIERHGLLIARDDKDCLVHEGIPSDHDRSHPQYQTSDSHLCLGGNGDWMFWTFGERLWSRCVDSPSIRAYLELLAFLEGRPRHASSIERLTSPSIRR